MFPFLSVLCAVIGVLMLFLIMTISTRIVQSEAVNIPDRPGPEPIGEAGSLSPEDVENLRAKLALLNGSLEERQGEYQELLDQRARLEELLALREAEQIAAGEELLQGVELSPQQQVVMTPEEDVRQRPRYIEVDLEGFVVHPEGRRYPVGELPEMDEPLAPDHVVSTRFEQILADADERRDGQYLVFLVKPSGCDNFHRVRNYLIAKYPHIENSELSRVPMGWEPFSPDWLMIAAPRSGPEEED